MVRGIAFIFLIFSATCAAAQDVNWKKTKNWKLYKLNSRAAFSYPVDTLHNFESIKLNDDSIRHFLSSASVWPKEKKTLWMGLLIASYETDNNELRKVNISNYGGFFYDENAGIYFELPNNVKNAWMNYLNDCLDQLLAH